MRARWSIISAPSALSPVPPMLLDMLLGTSITVSVLILMTALFIQAPLEFSAFPTILLISTMLRLSLNLASTRLILSHGHEGSSAAGHVIEAFGHLMMQGNFVIGIIVFAALSLFSPYDPTAVYVVIPDQPPSAQFWFGTNSRGQDMFWLLTFAFRNTLSFGLTVAIVSRIISLLVGLTSGYIGGSVANPTYQQVSGNENKSGSNNNLACVYNSDSALVE